MSNPMELPPEKRDELRKKKWTGEPQGERHRTEWQQQNSRPYRSVPMGTDEHWQNAYHRLIRNGMFSYN